MIYTVEPRWYDIGSCDFQPSSAGESKVQTAISQSKRLANITCEVIFSSATYRQRASHKKKVFHAPRPSDVSTRDNPLSRVFTLSTNCAQTSSVFASWVLSVFTIGKWLRVTLGYPTKCLKASFKLTPHDSGDDRRFHKTNSWGTYLRTGDGVAQAETFVFKGKVEHPGGCWPGS